MIVLIHLGYWATGAGIMGLVCGGVVGTLQQVEMNARWPTIRWPRWLARVGHWIATGVAVLALAAFLLLLPYMLGAGIWSGLPK